VVSLTFEGGRASSARPVLTGIPKAGNHNGGRIAFGPDGQLYVATGDAGETDQAQDRGSLGGKILRITADGKPAPGNPFGGSPVWSWGHRNVQGIAWDEGGTMYASEFGQNRWDEVNVIRKGANYGWPVVEGRGGDDRYVDPLRQWTTDDASPSGIAVTPDGTLYMAALRGESLWRMSAEAGRVGEPDRLLAGRYGRLRDVRVGPDGRLWVLTKTTRCWSSRPPDSDAAGQGPGVTTPCS
jgi:glucose/arabinose dehydrogenase